MLESELETAVRLAREAGRVILEYYRDGFEAEEKVGADDHYEPVTVADRAASRLIVDGLESAFPGDGILSEEEPDSHQRLDRRRVWMIDPLDGTAGFIRGDGDFAVQIGLAEDGDPVLGIVYLPIENLMFWAVSGQGAFVADDGDSGRRLETSATRDFGLVNLAVSRNHYSPKMKRVVETLGVAREIRRGSVGLKIGLIARNQCDLYVHLSPRTKQWDTCAPQVIVEEAGGRLTDLFGRRIVYNTRSIQNHNGIVASNGALHESTVERLRPLLNEFGREFRHPA